MVNLSSLIIEPVDERFVTNISQVIHSQKLQVYRLLSCTNGWSLKSRKGSKFGFLWLVENSSVLSFKINCLVAQQNVSLLTTAHDCQASLFCKFLIPDFWHNKFQCKKKKREKERENHFSNLSYWLLVAKPCTARKNKKMCHSSDTKALNKRIHFQFGKFEL